MADEQDIEVRTGGKEVPHVFGSDSGTRTNPGGPESDGGEYIGRMQIRLCGNRPR